jgi:DNA-binding response OmpR family regulator
MPSDPRAPGRTADTTPPSTALRVLLVEDELALRQGLGALFEAAGHRVDFAGDGRSGLALALAEPPDVLVLDLGLPGLDGLSVCAELRLRADRHVPVLMLTARDALEDKLRGFAAGADDYLVKPFAGAELLARCVALSQRHRAGREHLLCIGSLRVDRRGGEAWRGERALNLPRIAALLLLALAEAHPRTLTRSELTDRIWPHDPPPSDPLRSHLYLLRQALDREGERPMLVTVHGVGFRLQSDD